MSPIVMPRYFFHVRDSGVMLDDAGIELAGLAEAREMAVTTAGEELRDLGGKVWESPEWLMWVTDERGETVCSIKFTVDAGAPSQRA